MQAAIVEALRKVGAEVLSLAPLGTGVPDLLVFYEGQLFLLEVKSGTKKPSAQRLTADQESFHARWPVDVVRSVSEALAVVCGVH